MQQVTLLSVREWDKLVESTYGKPYNFQQQDGVKERGIYQIQVPCWYAEEFDVENNELRSKHDMQVSFKGWLKRSVDEPLGEMWQRPWTNEGSLILWWERQFYPAVEMIANDLHQKGLLPTGDYVINIDW